MNLREAKLNPNEETTCGLTDDTIAAVREGVQLGGSVFGFMLAVLTAAINNDSTENKVAIYCIPGAVGLVVAYVRFHFAKRSIQKENRKLEAEREENRQALQKSERKIEVLTEVVQDQSMMLKNQSVMLNNQTVILAKMHKDVKESNKQTPSERLKTARELAGFDDKRFHIALIAKLGRKDKSDKSSNITSYEEYKKFESGDKSLIKFPAIMKACEELLHVKLIENSEEKDEEVQVAVVPVTAKPSQEEKKSSIEPQKSPTESKMSQSDLVTPKEQQIHLEQARVRGWLSALSHITTVLYTKERELKKEEGELESLLPKTLPSAAVAVVPTQRSDWRQRLKTMFVWKKNQVQPETSVDDTRVNSPTGNSIASPTSPETQVLEIKAPLSVPSSPVAASNSLDLTTARRESTTSDLQTKLANSAPNAPLKSDTQYQSLPGIPELQNENSPDPSARKESKVSVSAAPRKESNASVNETLEKPARNATIVGGAKRLSVFTTASESPKASELKTDKPKKPSPNSGNNSGNNKHTPSSKKSGNK